jgi:hypothetical protein
MASELLGPTCYRNDTEVPMLRFLLEKFTAGDFRRFETACADPEDFQSRLWGRTQALLTQAPYWKSLYPTGVPEHLEEFPISEFSTYLPTLDADFQKSISSLNGEKILFWSESSGTTGKRKLFPITRTYQKQFQATNGPLIYSLLKRFPNFFRKKAIYFASALPQEKSPAGVDVGFISGHNYRHLPKIIQRAYGFPIEIFAKPTLFEVWAPFYAVIADLSAMIAITPGRVRLLAENITSRKVQILKVLDERKFPDGLPFPKITSARLEIIRKALAAPILDFGALWPNLEMIGCWKSSVCALQVAALGPYLGKETKVVDVTYSATEGWINVPLSSEDSGGPFHPGAIIAEFSEAGTEPDPKKLLKPWQLRPGHRYEIFITNTMGLVRYRLYDIILCKGFHRYSPIIEFSGKAAQELPLGMIRVSGEQFVTASAKLPVLTKCDFIFGPVAEGNRIAVYVSERHSDEKSAIEMEIEVLHQSLTDLNPYYRRDTTNSLLALPILKWLPANHAIWQARNGTAHLQAKPQILTQTVPD